MYLKKKENILSLRKEEYLFACDVALRIGFRHWIQASWRPQAVAD